MLDWLAQYPWIATLMRDIAIAVLSAILGALTGSRAGARAAATLMRARNWKE